MARPWHGLEYLQATNGGSVMSRMKDHLIECQNLLKAGEYQQLLEKLKPWGYEAPSELWAVMAWLVVMEQDGEYVHYQAPVQGIDSASIEPDRDQN